MEEKPVQNPITEDTLTELSIIREKMEVVLNCIIDNTNAREQTLSYIAGDYLAKMREMIRAMQDEIIQVAHQSA